MITQKILITPHPLLQQFAEWGQFLLEDGNYYTINNSLWAAEAYIQHRYDFPLTPRNTTGTAAPKGRVLSQVQGAKVLLPEVAYVENGEYKIFGATNVATGGHHQYWDEASELFISWRYLLGASDTKVVSNTQQGFITKASPFSRYVDEANSGNNAVTPPAIQLADGQPIAYPSFVPTATVSVDIVINGKQGDKVILDGVDTTVVLNATGKATITLPTTGLVNEYSIRLQRNIDPLVPTYSDEERVVFLHQDAVDKPTVVVLNHDRVTNNGNANIAVYASEACTINGQAVTAGVTTITLAVTADVTPLVCSLGTTLPALVCKRVAMPDTAVVELNKYSSELPWMPTDLLMAFFRLAYHFFSAADTKSEDIDRYSAGASKAITFGTRNIPKDIITILGMYMEY